MLWVMIPTKFPEKYAKVSESWRKNGYKIIININDDDENEYEADAMIAHTWNGAATSYNRMTQYLLKRHPDFTGVVAAADDISTEIDAKWYEEYFLKKFSTKFGIIQAKKNCFNFDCCESPLIGKTFIQVGYSGKGAYNERYGHWFCDSELELIAMRLNVYVADHTIGQPHDQWRLHTSVVPSYVQKTYEQDKLYFESRKRALLKMGYAETRKDFIMDLNTREDGQIDESGNTSHTKSNRVKHNLFRQRSK